jgi:glycerol-3-phosphate acyltransferase PlsY
MVVSIVCILGAYLSGSIPFGLLIAKAKGVDIRTAGSGNIGATNVARTLGKPLGVLVLVLDAAKGFAPVLVAARVLAQPNEIVAGAGLAAILGHVFPVWLRFRGGKGVATALGVFLALAPVAAAVAFGLYALVYAIFRISSMGSLVAATGLLVTMFVSGRPVPTLILGGAAWLLIVYKHRDNVARLLRGEEKKV